MRIGILTSVHPADDTRIYFKEARSLAAAGHEVYLVARSGAKISDIHYVELPTPRYRLGRLLTCFRIVYHAVRLRCSAYHIHDPELLPFGVLIRMLTGARLTYDAHENVRDQILNKYWIPRPLRRVVAGLYGLVERICMRWVTDVVLAVDSYLEHYRNHSVSIIHNYPIIQANSDPGYQRQYSGQPKLVYCGVVARIRGALEMIAATALLKEENPHVELHIIGSCFPEEFQRKVLTEIERFGLSRQVILHGRMPLDEALQVVAQCDIGLALLHPTPNYVESLPTKMFEYMSLRLPVVVSNFALWERIVSDAECGVAVDPLSPEKIAEAITTMSRDLLLLSRYGNNGRESVLKRYSWAAEVRHLLRIYSPALETDPLTGQTILSGRTDVG